MSVSIGQQPTSGTIYAKNTVPKLILYANEDVIVKVWFKAPEDGGWEPDNIMIEATYIPDLNGQITIDYEGLYDAFMKTLFPLSSGNSLYQEVYWYSFSASIVGMESETSLQVGWRVANAILNSSTAYNDWADGNFLTNQPLEKVTNKDAPEWLTYLDDAQGDRILKARFYPKSGGKEDVTVFTSPETGCYTINVSYNRLIKMSSYLSGQLLGYYDLILFDSKASEICRQRYIYDERTGKEKYFLFVNALGGIDTLLCQGENSLNPELTLNTGRCDRRHISLDDSDNCRQWTQQTGHMPYRWRDWLYELMTVRQGAWKYANGNYIPIVVVSAEIAMGDGDQLAAASFSYMLENMSRAISDTERASERTLHASVAEEAEELDDLTTQTVLEFSPSQGGGYATEAVAIPATHIYVTVEATSTVYVMVNGSLAEEIDPASRMPVVIEIDPGDEVSFDSQDEIDTVTVNYYPDEDYIASQTASAQQQTES